METIGEDMYVCTPACINTPEQEQENVCMSVYIIGQRRAYVCI